MNLLFERNKAKPVPQRILSARRKEGSQSAGCILSYFRAIMSFYLLKMYLEWCSLEHHMLGGKKRFHKPERIKYCTKSKLPLVKSNTGIQVGFKVGSVSASMAMTIQCLFIIKTNLHSNNIQYSQGTQSEILLNVKIFHTVYFIITSIVLWRLILMICGVGFNTNHFCFQQQNQQQQQNLYCITTSIESTNKVTFSQ